MRSRMYTGDLKTHMCMCICMCISMYVYVYSVCIYIYNSVLCNDSAAFILALPNPRIEAHLAPKKRIVVLVGNDHCEV